MRGFKYILILLLFSSTVVFAVDTDGDGYDDDVDLFPDNPFEWIDTDLDGVGNNSDPDIDDDGLDNGVDNNGNSLINGEDNNDDGDLVINIYDPLPHDPSEWLDTDNDGLGNNTDTDDDDDGVPDLLDVFPLNSQESLDTDNDGLGNNADPDDDTHRITGVGDGVLDVYDQFPLDPLETIDTDLDGIGNNADIDDDGDNVNDGEDAFPLDFNVNADQDGDGLGNAQDPDIDGDGIVNTLDVFPYDVSEWYDTDGDGIGNNTDLDDDTHDVTGVGDGVLDVDDALPLDPIETIDTDNDGIGNNADDDDDGDGVQDGIDAFPLNSLEHLDFDGDGVGDNSDADIDGDDVDNGDDAFPFLASEQFDLDDDGTGDNSDPDIDGDGITNINDAFDDDVTEYIDTDGDGIGNNADDDDDGDGVDDSLDAFSLDASEWEDTDGDGLGNNTDSDDDNDGIPDLNPDGSILDDFPLNPFEELDTDNDGVGNNTDLDDDGDIAIGGLPDATDAFPFNPDEWLDTDGDGLGNRLADSDDDNDGIVDADDAFPLNPAEWLDTDNDDTGNNADTDDDGDIAIGGLPDATDAFPFNPDEWLDTDGDGLGNRLADSDDDNDGFPDAVDAFPLNSAEWLDTDDDGTGNNTDLDDDGDDFADNIDLFPLDKNEWLDADNDGIGDNADSDDDNDGVRDIEDAFPNNPVETLDTDGDGLGNIFDSDDDGDGFSDLQDQLPLNPTEHLDTDGDLVGNNTDDDDDGDGMSDEFENSFNFNSLDAFDALLDTDQDGINNVNEFIAESNPLRDDYPPVITPPQSVHIKANHSYTELKLSTLIELTHVSVSDGLDGENCCNLTALGFETGAKNITSGEYPIEWRAVDNAGNEATKAQVLNVHPLVNFSAKQTVAEGGTARVNVTLSGLSPVYPLDLPFSITGSVDAADYQLGINKIVIEQGTEGFIDIRFNTDFELEGEEQLILTFVPGVNGGINSSHIINVVETNVAPSITLTLEQDNIATNQIAKDDGEATINLAISDSNIDDKHVISWELPDYLSAEVSANKLQVYIDPLDVELPDENKGLIDISVTVTDSGSTTNSGSEPLSQTKQFAFSLVNSLPRLSTTDTDGDGDSDIVEGFSDDDNDGLPNYLDTSTISYLQPLHTNSSVFSLAETEPGLSLQLGKYAKLQFSDGLQLSQQEIDATGLITSDTLVNQGGYFDFEIHQITPFGRSVFLVVPLSLAIVEYSVYRKFTTENSWQDFVIDGNNAIASSEAVNGVCPPPHSELYQEGLIIGNVCLRLYIEDGGANDSDGIANGVIDDPGGIAVVSNDIIAKDTAPEKSSSGSFSYIILMGFTLIILFRVYPFHLKMQFQS
ncbi:MAG: hypothetical protein ACJAXJ_002921 [Colwellia sp.]|jgi:hypothetical protein